jgi:hypothetical protein
VNIDDIRPDLAYLLVSQPEPVDSGGADIVDQHVAGLDQAAHGLAALLRLHVPDDGSFAAIEAQVNRPHTGRLGGRADHACGVALGRLDLDHVRAQIGQDLRAIGTENDRGQIGDANPGERAFAHASLLFLLSRYQSGAGPDEQPHFFSPG